MGIYLPNMEMPEDGAYFCEVGVIDGVGTITFHTEERQVFRMVEVPPHGRLIEEPKQLSYGGLAYISPNDFIGIAKYFSDQIKAMPTIVEAEE